MTFRTATHLSDLPTSSRYDPRCLLVGSAVWIVGIACLGSWQAAILAVSLGLLWSAHLRIGWRWLVPRLTVLLSPTLILAGLLALTTSDGWADGLLIICRAGAISLVAFSLIGSTYLLSLAQAATRLGVPSVLVRMLLLAVRYLHLLADELARVRMALRVRGYRNRVGWHSYRTVGRVAGVLLVRGAERAERVSQAMRCRSYSGQFRCLQTSHTRWADVGLLGGSVLALAGLLSLDFWLRGG